MTLRRAALCFIVGVMFAIAAHFALRVAGASTSGLTPDMIRVALSSANVSTAPGSHMRLLDRTTGAWHDFVLQSFTVTASGGHATINIQARQVN